MTELPAARADTRRVRFGVFRFDPDTGDLWKDDRCIRLQDQPRQVLRLLVARPGQLISRDELQRALWPDDTFVDFDTGLNVAINKVRQALDDSASAPRFVETLARRGYRFVAPVTGRTDDAGAAGQSLTTSSRSRSFVWIAALVVIVAAFAAVWWTGGAASRSLDRPIRAVAVLPFDIRSGDGGQGYIADGVTDALTTDLASLRALQVIAGQSAKQYRGSNKPMRTIAAELGVDALIHGSVQRIGDRMRVDVWLIDPVGDRHIWAMAYERDVRDTLRLQREMALALAREMRVSLTAKEQTRLATAPAVDSAAHDSYLRGLYLRAGHGGTDGTTTTAIEAFEKAIALDPTFAPAYAALAEAQLAAGTVFRGQPPLETRRLAFAVASKALELDPELASAHAVQARVLQSELDWAGAEASFRRALDLDANDHATLILYAQWLVVHKRYEEAIESARRAESLDPLNLGTRVVVGFTYWLARHPDEAIRRYQDVLKLDPERTLAKFYLISALADRSRAIEAVAIARAELDRHGRQPNFVSKLAYAAGRAGRRDEALAAIEELLAISRREYVSPALVAIAYVGLGDDDRALEWLDRAYAERSNFVMLMTAEPFMDSLRRDPRYNDLIAKITRSHTARVRPSS